MMRKLANFIRGSQLLGHLGFMFSAGLKGPAIVTVIVLGWTSWWQLSHGLTDHETYLIWMRAYAAAYTWMEFDPHKDVVLITVAGGSIHLPISLVENWPAVRAASAHMVDLLLSAWAWSALMLVPGVFAFAWFAARFGRKARERKHERGATKVELPQLVAQIRQHNREARNRERHEAMGWRWRLCLPSELAAVLPYHPSRLASVTYPWRLEQSHAMLIGTTGMGKTVALSDMLAEARRRGQRAVVFDLTGAFIENFYDAARDVILNPLDARCPQWSVFDECRDKAEFMAAAAALVPHDGGGQEQFWVLGARTIFVEACLKLRALGLTSNEALAHELMTADLSRVHDLLRGTIADPLTAPAAARMAESIRAVFNVNAMALMMLPTQGPRFSVRDWVEDDEPDGGVVFISARYVDMSVCSQLLTVWLDLAMNTLMTLERTRDLRMWFFIDEMGALHRLPALEKGLQTARNYGGAIVTGIHAYAKLKEVYGENMAITLSSLARTKLILGTGDRNTATWCSDLIGHTEGRDVEEGHTYGYNNTRDAVSLTKRKYVEPLVSPDQIMDLRSLVGYIKFPEGFPVAKVRLKPRKRPKRAEAFIRRAPDPSPEAPSWQAGAEAAQVSGAGRPLVSGHPSANDDGAGKRGGARQGELPLEPRATAPSRDVSLIRAYGPDAVSGAGGVPPSTAVDSPKPSAATVVVPRPAGTLPLHGGKAGGQDLPAPQGGRIGNDNGVSDRDDRQEEQAPRASSTGPVPCKLMPDDEQPARHRDQPAPRDIGDLDHDI